MAKPRNFTNFLHGAVIMQYITSTHCFCLRSSGKVGGWKEMFTAEQSALFDMIYAEKMKGSGLDFDFEL